MSNKMYATKLNQLKQDIKAFVKKTEQPSSYATLSDISSKVDGWKKDIDNLAMHTESVNPAFQSAKSAIYSAWESRGTRTMAMRSIKETLSALEGAEVKQVPEMDTYSQKSNRKGLLNEYASYKSMPSDLIPVMPIMTRLQGYMAMKSFDEYMPNDLRNMKRELQGLRYTPNLQQAVKSLDNALRAIEQNPRSVRQHLQQAVKSLDGYGVDIMRGEVENGRTSVKPEIGNARRSIKARLVHIQDMGYQYSFETPRSFLPQMYRAMKSVVNELNQYSDGELHRYGEKMLLNMEVAMRGYQSAVKSYGADTWDVDGAREAFERAQDMLARLVSKV